MDTCIIKSMLHLLLLFIHELPFQITFRLATGRHSPVRVCRMIITLSSSVPRFTYVVLHFMLFIWNCSILAPIMLLSSSISFIHPAFHPFFMHKIDSSEAQSMQGQPRMGLQRHNRGDDHQLAREFLRKPPWSLSS